MKEIVESIVGTYTPNAIVINDTVVPLEGVGSLDIAYVTSCILLIITFATFFIALREIITK